MYQQYLVVESLGGGDLVVERAVVDSGGPTRSPSRLAPPDAGVLLKTAPSYQPSSGITAPCGGKKAQVCPLTWLGTPLNGPACCRAPVALAKAFTESAVQPGFSPGSVLRPSTEEHRGPLIEGVGWEGVRQKEEVGLHDL